MATIRFGSNIFTPQSDFTIVGVDEKGGVIMGGFGPSPVKPLVWVTFKGPGAYLNAELCDADNELVLRIKDNVITFNKGNVYSVQTHPDNQIPPDRVVVLNQYGETAMDLRKDGPIWDFNGDFYWGKAHIVATPEGTIINPTTPQV